jgi:hypothetical protein
MALSDANLTRVAQQARALASEFETKPVSEHTRLMQDLRGLLELYFHDGKLDPTIQQGILDAKVLGLLLRDSEWLMVRKGHMSGNESAPVARRLRGLAKTLDDLVAEKTGAAPPVVQPAPIEGAETFNNWLLIGGRLGHGGQGEVTLVRHVRSFERGALKRMTGPRALTDKGTQRFLREIEAFKNVRHPYVVAVLDAGETPEPYLVTEVAGFGSLHDNLRAFRGDLWRCLRLARCVALGLEAAHSANIIHRDIKPKNILLENLDHPLVADFGIAHFSERDSLTSTGSHPGAYKFAPQEYEFEGEEPTPAFDVFSLGEVLHLAITGNESKKPYRTLGKLQSVGQPDDARPRAVDHLIAELTCRDAADRIQSMETVVARIDDILEQLFDRAPDGPGACACGTGRFADLGELVLAPGTEINVYPKGAGNPGARGLREWGPRLERCTGCAALRFRATTG